MQTFDYKVSVIVPIYKAEKYIRRCLDSLVSQTLAGAEILLIDDGSPDSSGDICEEYAARHPELFKVFHNQNQGVSASRQFGIDHAQGEYSIHADPDDWVEPTMLEELYSKAKADDADMVICDFFEEKKSTTYSCQRPDNHEAKSVLKEMFTHLHGSCWNKLVRHRLYKDLHVEFPKGFSCFEDLYVVTSLLRHDIKISYLPKAFYHYDKSTNENSIVRKYTLKSYHEDLQMFETYRRHAETLGEAKDLCLHTVSTHLIARAFNSLVFDSKAFKENFQSFIPLLESNPRLKPGRKRKFILSCKGYYNLYRYPMYLLHQLKSLLKK